MSATPVATSPHSVLFSPTPVPDQVPEASSEDVDTDLPELAPFPEVGDFLCF